MRKLLISILLGLLIYLSYYIIANGVEINKINILSIPQVKQENDKIDNKIKEISKLTSSDFFEKSSDLNGSFKNLSQAKESYTDLATYSSAAEIQKANEIENYLIEVLWAKIGKYATEEGVKIKINITSSQDATQTIDGRKLYDLNFTVTGQYILTSSFISDLENDSKLEFKIQNFKMIQGTDGNLQTTFIVKNIPIQGIDMNINSNTTSNAIINNTTSNTVTNNAVSNSTNTNTVKNNVNTINK